MVRASSLNSKIGSRSIPHPLAWWRHQMETFSVLLALCAVNSPVTGEFPPQKPAARSLDVFFHLRLNKRLSKQSSHWLFETPSHSLWRHCNGVSDFLSLNLLLLLNNNLLPVDNALRWRHNDHAGVSNHQPHGCLLNRLFRRKSKKTSKLRVTGLCAWNSPGTGEFPAQMASYAENVSIWWRHHGMLLPMHTEHDRY